MPKMEIGTLVDRDILALTARGQLITRDFLAAGVKQACYELRASPTFFTTASAAENKRKEVGAEGFLLGPFQYVTCIVMETIELPDNMLARILAKGQLFSLGIIPVNTYADPGFSGRLGITLCNFSHRYITIRPGQAIAKIEFTVLPKSVAKPYSGQHGFETEIWPIPAQFVVTDQDARTLNILGTDSDEIEKSFGPRMGDLARKLDFYANKANLHLLVMIGMFAILFILYERVPFLISVIAGIASNAVTQICFWSLEKRGRAVSR